MRQHNLKARLFLLFVITVITDTAVSTTLHTSAFDHVARSQRYTAFSNYPYVAGSPSDPSRFRIFRSNWTQVGPSCPTPRIRTCQRWGQGLFPTLSSSTTPKTNGGVPQRANLTLHLQEIELQLPRWIPEEDWAGNGVLDFEAWTPIFGENTDGDCRFHGRCYQEYSVALVRQDHPTLNESAVRTIAKREFETAGVRFFAATLTLLRRLRPRAKFGFYGLPAGVYGHCTNKTDPATCGYGNRFIGHLYRKANDKLGPVWGASGALFPSVYLPPQGPTLSAELWAVQKHAWVQQTVTEAFRLSATFSPRKGGVPAVPVLPYFWPYYHNGTTAVTAADVALVITLSWKPPIATGLVVWAPSSEERRLEVLMPENDGRQLRAAVDAAQMCSAASCSGNGFCRNLSLPLSYPAANRRTDLFHKHNHENAHSRNTSCVCDSGWRGEDCSRPTR